MPPKVHTCLECGYSTIYKTHMIRHLYKVERCGDIDSNKTEEMHRLYPIISVADDKNKCAECGRNFKCSKSIYRHRKTCPATGMTGNSSSGSQSACVRAFGQENVSSISNAFIKACSDDGDEGIAKMVKRIFAEIPENRNVRPSNERNQMLVYREADGWVIDDFDDIKEAMVKRAIGVVKGLAANGTYDPFPIYFRVCELLDRMKFCTYS